MEGLCQVWLVLVIFDMLSDGNIKSTITNIIQQSPFIPITSFNIVQEQQTSKTKDKIINTDRFIVQVTSQLLVYINNHVSLISQLKSEEVKCTTQQLGIQCRNTDKSYICKLMISGDNQMYYLHHQVLHVSKSLTCKTIFDFYYPSHLSNNK